MEQWLIDEERPCEIYIIRRDTKPPMRMRIATVWGRSGDEAKATAKIIVEEHNK